MRGRAQYIDTPRDITHEKRAVLTSFPEWTWLRGQKKKL